MGKELDEVPRDLDSTRGNGPKVSSGGAGHLASVQALHLLERQGVSIYVDNRFTSALKAGTLIQRAAWWCPPIDEFDLRADIKSQ